MKFEVVSVSIVEAPDWKTAETAVERRLVEPTEITSKPYLGSPEQFIEYGIQKKILTEQAKLFFEDVSYEVSIKELETKAKIWLENILYNCIKKNESNWK